MSTPEEIAKEIKILESMDTYMDNYIDTFRNEQHHFNNFMQEMFVSSWKGGNSNAFFERAGAYNSSFFTHLQSLENTHLEIIETKKMLELLQRAMDTTFD